MLLRNIIPEDRDFIISLWTDPEVTKYMGGPRDQNAMMSGVTENLIDPFKEEYDLWVLEDKRNGNRIGHCGLLKKEVDGTEEIEVIYVIDKKYWGTGCASEIARILIDYAFEKKETASVIALINPQNIASQKVALKAGMKQEKEVLRCGNIKMQLYRKTRK